MSQITRCPHCATTFKVVADQLRISDGWVRCGQCKELFDASEHLLVSGAEQAASEALPAAAMQAPEPAAQTQQPEDAAGGERVAGGDEPIALSALLRQESTPPPTEAAADELKGYELPGVPESDSGWMPEAADDGAVEPAVVDELAESAEPEALAPEPLPSSPDEPEAATVDGGADAQEQAELQALVAEEPEPMLAEEAALLPAVARLEPESDAVAAGEEPQFVRAARRREYWHRPWVRGALVLTGLVCVLALALQIVLQERDEMVARSPGLRGLVEQLCAPLRCTVQPPRRIDAVTIDSSSFVKVRSDDASYELQVGIKNHAPYAVAMPALELTLTDAQDQTLLRRVLLPADLDAPAQLAPGAIWSHAVVIEVAQGAAAVAGYRLLAFYP